MPTSETHWFNQGEQFSQAANILWNASGVTSSIENIQNLKVFPYIVNLAFAMECYSKCLLTLNGVDFRRTHDLLALFNLLAEREKSEVLEQYRIVSTRGEDDVNHLRSEVLPHIQHLFVHWRYPHDQSGQLEVIFNLPQWYHDALLQTCRGRLQSDG